MAKPMIEWLEHPDNQAMFEEIEDQMILMKSRGSSTSRRATRGETSTRTPSRRSATSGRQA